MLQVLRAVNLPIVTVRLAIANRHYSYALAQSHASTAVCSDQPGRAAFCNICGYPR